MSLFQNLQNDEKLKSHKWYNGKKTKEWHAVAITQTCYSCVAHNTAGDETTKPMALAISDSGM